MKIHTNGKFTGQVRPADIVSGIVVHLKRDRGKICGRKSAFMQSGPHGQTYFGGLRVGWSQNNLIWVMSDEVCFVEIGADKDLVHFLIQSVPVMSLSKIAQIVKGITGREIFKRHSETKKMLWGEHFWTSEYYVNTVGATGNERVIKEYVEKQRMDYKKIHRNQLSLVLE